MKNVTYEEVLQVPFLKSLDPLPPVKELVLVQGSFLKVTTENRENTEN